MGTISPCCSADAEVLQNFRACVSIHVLAAESALLSTGPAVVAPFSQAIHLWPNEMFDAVDAESWRALALNRPAADTTPSTGTTFIDLAKLTAQIQSIAALQSTAGPLKNRFLESQFLYGDIVRLHMENSSTTIRVHNMFPNSPQVIEAIWHYTCLRGIVIAQLYHGTAHAQDIATRISSAPTFLHTPWARLAILHASHVLLQCEKLAETPFLLPR